MHLPPKEIMPNAATIQGHIDLVHDNTAIGWAHSSASQEPLIVEVLCGQKMVARGETNVFRPDLKIAGLGNGHSGFRLTLSYELFDGNVHVLTAREATTKKELHGSVEFSSEPSDEFIDLIPRSTAIRMLTNEILSQKGLLAVDPERLILGFHYASLLQETLQTKSARSAYALIGQLIPWSAILLIKIAETWRLEGEVEKAEIEYRRATNVAPDSFAAYAGLGVIASLQGRPHDAQDWWNRALELDPKNSYIRKRLNAVNLACVAEKITSLAEAGRLEDAIDLMMKHEIPHSDLPDLLDRVIQITSSQTRRPDLEDDALLSHSIESRALQFVLNRVAMDT